MNAPALDAGRALVVWRDALARAIVRHGPDLSARQMAVLLTVYTADPPHTVRGLAERLGLAKPPVTRALDRLEEEGFVRRQPDPADRRSVVIGRTVRGSVYLREFADLIVTLAADPG